MKPTIGSRKTNEVGTVLLVEDSRRDIVAIRRLWSRLQISHHLMIVKDGMECLDYLFRRGQFSDLRKSPSPSALLLGLKLPKLDGFEILDQLKNTPELKRLPVFILTKSNRNEDVNRAYDSGANIYLSKPTGIQKLGELLTTLISLIQIMRVSEEALDGTWRNGRGSKSAT